MIKFVICSVKCDIQMIDLVKLSMSFTHSHTHTHWKFRESGVATIGRLIKNIGFFCRIWSLLYGSFTKETYDLKEPTNRSHPIVSSVTHRWQIWWWINDRVRDVNVEFVTCSVKCDIQMIDMVMNEWTSSWHEWSSSWHVVSSVTYRWQLWWWMNDRVRDMNDRVRDM